MKRTSPVRPCTRTFGFQPLTAFPLASPLHVVFLNIRHIRLLSLRRISSLRGVPIKTGNDHNIKDTLPCLKISSLFQAGFSSLEATTLPVGGKENGCCWRVHEVEQHVGKPVAARGLQAIIVKPPHQPVLQHLRVSQGFLSQTRSSLHSIKALELEP